jgi:hypothetical protein
MNSNPYRLYFKFRKNIDKYPCLALNDNVLKQLNEKELKRYVKSVLESNHDGLSVKGKDGGKSKYFGCESFAEMSREIAQNWNDLDRATQSVFKEIAKEGAKRQKDVSLHILTSKHIYPGSMLNISPIKWIHCHCVAGGVCSIQSLHQHPSCASALQSEQSSSQWQKPQGDGKRWT